MFLTCQIHFKYNNNNNNNNNNSNNNNNIIIAYSAQINIGI